MRAAVAIWAAAGAAGAFAAASRPVTALVTPAVQSTDVAAAEALDSVNLVRQLSGLHPVSMDPALSAPAGKHSCWMVTNDKIGHTENPGSPGYSADGAASAGRSNVAVSSSPDATARSFVGLWMTGPYHAVSILDPRLGSVGYGQCTDGTGTWRAAATLDVLAGLAGGTPDRVVTFPADGAAVPWGAFVTESPNPLANCASDGGQWTSAGLPLFTLLPESPLPGATATLTGPGGHPVELCVVTQHNDVSDVGRSILSARQAMIAVPRQALADGRYDVTFHTGHRTVSWSFVVDSSASSPYALLATASTPKPAVSGAAPRSTYLASGPHRTWDTRRDTGRLRGGDEHHVPIGQAPAGATAVVVNITTTDSDPSGWVAVYPCGRFGGTSTSNFAAGRTGSTTTVVQLGADGVCARTEGSTHLVADVTGWMIAGDGGAGFVDGEARAFDSRQAGRQIEPGERVRVVVAEPGASAAALNVTTTDVDDAGFVTVWPCRSTDDAVPTVSLGQGRPGPAQAAFGIIPVADDGGVCVYSSARMHLVIDVAGSFVEGRGSGFVAFDPLRRYDSRRAEPWASPLTPGARVRGDGQPVALDLRVDGMPPVVDAVMANVTVTSTADAGWLGAKSCGDAAETSDVNFDAADTVANMTIVPTDVAASACASLSATSHVIVDMFGVFVP